MVGNRGRWGRWGASCRAGFSLVELMLAMAVIAVALASAVGTIAGTAKLSQVDEETLVASQGARAMMECLQAADLRDAFALYNEVEVDDPGGAGTAPGAHFAVSGLDPLSDDADGMVGRILLPVAADFPGVLREDLFDPSFGMPRDLDLDRDVDGDDHAADYVVLPIRVQVRWRGPGGARVLELDTILTSR